MSDFPTDAEIVTAIRLLAKANVLREYHVRQVVDQELLNHYGPGSKDFQVRVTDECLRLMSSELVSIQTGGANWSDYANGYGRSKVCEVTGWVISYADARRALDPAP